MKKENYIALVLTVAAILVFGVGLCMCLIPEWELFQPGVVVTAMGLVFLVVLGLVRWFRAGRPVAKVNAKRLGIVIYGIVAALVLGVGMCMVLVFEGMMGYGIVVGIVGILMLLGLIPMLKGFQ